MTSLRPPPPYAAVVGPSVVAHRGGALESPENTLAAIRHGVATGAEWQEVDVTLSRDGIVVLMHDETLERTTTGQGKVGQKTLAQLQSLEIRDPQSLAPGQQLRIPTLTEVLDVHGARLMIELKSVSRPERLVSAVIETVARAAALDRVMLGSFDRELLWAVYNRDPSVPLVGIADSVEEMERMLMLPLAVMAVSKDIATEALEYTPAGVAVWCYTVIDLAEAQKLALMGVHGLITDVPQAVIEALRTPPPAIMKLSR